MTARIRELESAKAEIAAAELAVRAIEEAAGKISPAWPGHVFIRARLERLLEEIAELKLRYSGLLMTGD
jgi:hypothetical protein